MSSDKVEPAIYAPNIENCGDCRVKAQLDHQHGAFHRTNPELGGGEFRPPARALASASHDGQDDNDQDAGNMPT